MRAFGMVAVGLALVAAPLAAQTPDAVRRALEDAERARAATQGEQTQAAARLAAAEAEERRLAAERVAAAALLREAEAATLAAAARVRAVEARGEAASAAIAARAAQLAPLLPLMQRLALNPIETLLVVPAPPDRAMAGLMLLRAAGARLEREAAGLVLARDAATATAAELLAELPALERALARQRELAADLDRRLAEARELRDEAAEAVGGAARRAEQAAARANDLRQAIARLEAEQRAEEARARAAAERAERAAREARTQAERAAGQERAERLAREAAERREQEAAVARRRESASRSPGPGPQRGQMTSPIAGIVLRGFGDRGDGVAAQGVSWRGPPSARVVSPCGGRIVYAGVFRSYGRMLIVDCGGGYHFVLAGLDRLDARAGAAVSAGEPVGAMADYDLRASGERPTLYGELRYNGAAVDPAPFLRARG